MVMGVVRKEAHPYVFQDHNLLQVEMNEAKNGFKF